jgi:hypothetical protein
MRLDFIDFPTGFELQGRIGHAADAHLHRGCSAVLSEGALLCDCGAIAVEWAKLGGRDWLRYVPAELTNTASAALPGREAR